MTSTKLTGISLDAPKLPRIAAIAAVSSEM